MANFHKQLVLNHWMMSFFNDGNLLALKNRLGKDRHEGIEEDGQSGFFHALQHDLFQPDLIDQQDLRRYDLNIVQHWNAITEQRNKIEGTVLNMKYFQYLSLLFTEIYLDWYFNQRQQLLDGLNREMQTYNDRQAADHRFQSFAADELNKLAFWNATGSGKTLLLHVNIHHGLAQYGPRRRLADHSVIRARRALERQSVFAQTQHAWATTQRDTPGKTGNAEYFWGECELYGRFQGLSERRRHYTIR